ncbi:MAG: MFS transporter [Draconibacterium sp.]|nr:MFS transporter [Draconibacterium sp.]
MNSKNLIIIFLTTLMAVLGVASITPAFPSIIKHFNISPTQVTLLITVFTLPGILLAPVAGIMADRIGRKIILIPSLFIFGIAGAGCFVTNSWEVLLILRFIQGIGAASLGTLNITLIGDLYEGKKRSEIMGYNASVLSIGTAAYPTIGGAVAMVGWQFPFLLPLLAIPIGLFAIIWLKNPEPKKQYSLREYLRNTWTIINRKSVWGLFIINILLFVILYGAFLSYFPQMLESRFQSSAMQIGLYMSAFSLITAFISAQKKLIDKLISVKIQLNISFILYFISMLLLAVINERWQLFFPLVLFGIAHGILIPTIQILLVGFAPLNERAGFMSINSMVLRLGQTVGPVFIGLFYLLGGVSIAFVGGAAVALLMLLISILMVKTGRAEQ